MSGLAGAAYAETRTFTSSDGSKTLQASVLDYTPSSGAAKIKLSSGRVMNVPATAFSPSDQDYFKSWYQSTMAGRRISIAIRDDERQTGERKENNGKVKSIDSRFALNVRNNGKGSFEDLEVKYRVFYYRDGVDGKRNQHLTLDGSDQITTISPRQDLRLMTQPVKLTNIRPLPASECKGGT